MIYLFHGNDIEKVRTHAFAWITAARAKEKNLAYIRLAREELTDATLEEITFSGGLFVKRLLVLIDDPFPGVRTAATEEEEEKEENVYGLESRLDALQASDNAIVILAPKLSSVKAKKIETKATKIYAFDTRAEANPARGFNSALVNALAARSGAALWLEVNRAFMAGDAPEMVHGLLHWKARDLMKKGSRTWPATEARKLSMDLIEILQASRQSGLALDKGLERFALSV